ncbi:MAG TPA: PKD domain-containing protein [Saprospiraceae bacterium]
MAEAGFSFFTPVNVSWHLEDASGAIVFTNPGLTSSFTHTFNYPPGEYTWVATNTSDNYCTEIIRQVISVTALPEAPLGILGEEKICPGQLYGYTIESAGDYGTTWFITDGSSITTYNGQSIQHAFGPAPPYIVQAFHTDIQYNNCASDPISITLGSATDLVINGPDEVCFNGIDAFNTEYISGADYSWEIIPADHGEIRRSDLNEVSVFWSQTGNATLRLIICGVTIDKAVLVRALPAFNILGPTAACANELTAITTDLPLLAHQWVDENDNIISVQNNVQLAPGSFGVEITDGFGCSNEKTAQITSYPAPTVHLSTPYGRYYCTNIPGGVSITANTDGTDYTFTWFLDDIEIGPGGPVYGVTSFGEYHVVVTNQYGCKAVSEKISFEDCCPPNNCGSGLPGIPGGCLAIGNDFNIGLLETECHIHQHSPAFPGITPGSTWWEISSRSEGIIATANTDILNHTYQKPGYYQVVMIALINGFPYDATVCAHVDKLVDTVRAVADFASTGICSGTPVEFEDLTTFLPMETIASWNWNFGDPASGAANVSSDQHPTHNFSAPGTFEVTLTINLVSGCHTIKKRMVNISGGPVLLPQYDFIHCVDEAMAFQLPGDLYDIEWNFGDPTSGLENTALENSVFHTFNATGTFPITVEAYDIYECRSQTGFMVDIIPNTLSGLIDVNPLLPLCAGDTAVLTAPSGGISWAWSTDETTSVIEVSESNQYSVLITDQYHCTYSPPPVFVEVFPKPEVVIRAREVFGPDEYGPWSSSLSICYGSEFELSAFSTGAVSYHWTNGETTQVLQFTSEGSNLPAPGEYEYTLTTIDLFNNCISDSSSIQIEIFELPQTPVISLASGSGCSFSPNILQVNNPEVGVIYTWSDGQEGTSITVTKVGAYQVTAINQNGCSALSNTIIINPSAPVDQIPGGCFVKCDPLNVCLPPLSDVSSYTIYQNGNVFQSGTTWPSDFVITMDGSYTIEVTSTNGCVATSDPLDVVLYTGVGSITVETWLDQDGDGVISSGDVLLSGIPVQIISDDGLHIGKTETVPGGQFVFKDYPATQYLAHIDRSLLSSQYIVVIDSLIAQIATCDDSVVVSLLLRENCTVTGPDQFFELCPGQSLTLGDSTWNDIGTYEMHMSSTTGCDSVFQVMITPPDSIEINVSVWVDVDHDGVVSPSDTTIQGITIVLDRQISSDPFTGVTGANGELNDIYPTGNYVVFVDTMLLPPGLMVVYGEEYIPDTVCGVAEIEFLLVSSCTGVFIIHQETLCAGDSILVDGQWLTDEGQYTFVHTDSATLCDTIIDVYVTISEEIIIQPTVDWNCETLGSIQLEITGADPFIITWDNGFSGDSLLNGLDEGTYAVVVTDENGCNAADTIEVIASPELNFSVSGQYLVEEGDSVLISITGDINEPGLTFEWSPAGILSCPTCSTSYATPTNDTIVSIQITDADSCVYFLETNILITTDTTPIDEIFVPNVFSPNGDGINDFWRIFSKLENTHVQDLYVYDRWGTLVFYKEDFVLNTFIGWDGKLNGNNMNPGVFVYQANVTLGDGREVKVKGDVTLLR